MGLLTPLNLLYALSLAALVAIYLRARSRPTIEVSSLMLFEEIPAPVAKSRLLRLDALFWLEALALGAMSLAVAGLYVRRHQAIGPGHRHALVFDLGAGMSAGENGITRLDLARQLASRMIADAPAGDQFTVLGYALEVSTPRAAGSLAPDARKALEALVPTAVAARPAALRAALIYARAADRIDLFADRPPPPVVIDDAHLGDRLIFHQVGAPEANLAIVSLDAGVPRSSVGRGVVRNFSDRPQVCDLVIEAAGREVFHSRLVVEPRAEIVVPFGPLPAGGLVHARIATPDALPADNQRWALAQSIAHQHALVLSPDAAVRDDLARMLLAINRNFLVTAADPARPDSFDHARRYDLAVIHDTPGNGVNAAARLLIFPPLLGKSHAAPPVSPTREIAIAELEEREGTGVLSAPVLLGPARVLEPPPWMEPMARGIGVREHDSFPLAASGYDDGEAVGVLAFDVRGHLLLDPDRMDALVLTIDLLQRLLAPRDVIIETTGAFVTVAAGAHARVTAPDGSSRPLETDPWGRARFRTLESGRYLVTSDGPATAVYANYFDAAESDLSAPVTANERPAPVGAQAGPSQLSVRPIALPLVILALLALIGESILLAQRAARWRAAHV